MNPIERRIRTPLDREVYEGIREAFADKTDIEMIAELTRMIVIVAVCYNDAVERGQDPAKIFERHIFTQCDELAQHFPWTEGPQ
jgi:hypothetical protein